MLFYFFIDNDYEVVVLGDVFGEFCGGFGGGVVLFFEEFLDAGGGIGESV